MGESGLFGTFLLINVKEKNLEHLKEYLVILPGDSSAPVPPGVPGLDPRGGGAGQADAEAPQAESGGGPLRKVAFDPSKSHSIV